MTIRSTMDGQTMMTNQKSQKKNQNRHQRKMTIRLMKGGLMTMNHLRNQKKNQNQFSRQSKQMLTRSMRDGQMTKIHLKNQKNQNQYSRSIQRMMILLMKGGRMMIQNQLKTQVKIVYYYNWLRIQHYQHLPMMVGHKTHQEWQQLHNSKSLPMTKNRQVGMTMMNHKSNRNRIVSLRVYLKRKKSTIRCWKRFSPQNIVY